MSELITEYLGRLKAALSGADPATIQDALCDAEEHLWTALELAREERPGIPDSEAVRAEIERYGSPEEVATAYLRIGPRFGSTAGGRAASAGGSARNRFFGVFTDPSAYGALFYMFFSMITGIFYFTWAMTGLSLSAGLIVLIIGLPFLGIFLLSVRGIAHVEGRIIEALLGVRMPRRPIFARTGLSWSGRLSALIRDPMTWKSILYMLLMLPLGIIYFTVTFISLVLSFWGMLRPVLEYGFDLPYAQIDNVAYFTTGWMMPVVMATGVLWLFVTMHMARGLGRMHARMARSLLVRD